MKVKQTQKQFVKEILEKDGYISRNFCLRNYISRLGAIICSLEKDGYRFKAEYVPVSTTWGASKDYKYTVIK